MKTASFWSFNSYSIQPTICKLPRYLSSVHSRKENTTHACLRIPLTRVARQCQIPAVQTITYWPIHDGPYKTQSTFKSYT